MPSTVLSAAILGIDTYPVHVEVGTDRTLPTFTVVGLPDPTVQYPLCRPPTSTRRPT